LLHFQDLQVLQLIIYFLFEIDIQSETSLNDNSV